MTKENQNAEPKIVGGIPPSVLRRELQNWWLAKRLVATDFVEDTNPWNGPYDDYMLAYIAKFSPKHERQASLEIQVTDDGFVGIGVDKRQRVANILKVKNHWQGFVSGCEPGPLDIEEVMLVLNLVAGGNLTIRARVLPLYGLTRTRVVFNSNGERAYAVLVPKGYSPPSLNSRIMTRTLTCDPWQ